MHSYLFLSEILEWGHTLGKFGNLHFYTTFTFTQQECFALTSVQLSFIQGTACACEVTQR